jgi:hypothetical protein
MKTTLRMRTKEEDVKCSPQQGYSLNLDEEELTCHKPASSHKHKHHHHNHEHHKHDDHKHKHENQSSKWRIQNITGGTEEKKDKIKGADPQNLVTKKGICVKDLDTSSGDQCMVSPSRRILDVSPGAEKHSSVNVNASKLDGHLS